jgi:MFS family permease
VARERRLPFATSLRDLAILRGLACVFLSGAVPTALALLVEMTPQRLRSTFLSISLSADAAGSALCAGVAAWLLTARTPAQSDRSAGAPEGHGPHPADRERMTTLCWRI